MEVRTSRQPGIEQVVQLGTVAVIGGGCYGTFYAGQLERARARGAATYNRILVVDRDPACRAARELRPDSSRQLVVDEWGPFFDRFLDRPESQVGATPPDAIVPSPLMPHLMHEWLVRRARGRWPSRLTESRAIETPAGTPYDRLDLPGCLRQARVRCCFPTARQRRLVPSPIL